MGQVVKAIPGCRYDSVAPARARCSPQSEQGERLSDVSNRFDDMNGQGPVTKPRW